MAYKILALKRVDFIKTWVTRTTFDIINPEGKTLLMGLPGFSILQTWVLNERFIEISNTNMIIEFSW